MRANLISSWSQHRRSVDGNFTSEKTLLVFWAEFKSLCFTNFLGKKCWHGFFFIIMEKLSPFSAPLAAEVLPNGLINVIYFQWNYLIWAFPHKVWAIHLKPVMREYHHQITSVSTVRDICVPFWYTIGGLWCWAGNRHVLSYLLCYFSHVFRKLLLPPRCPLHQRQKSEMFYDTFMKIMFAFAEVDVFLCHSESSCSATKSFTQRISGFWAFNKPLLPLRSHLAYQVHTPWAHPDNMHHVLALQCLRSRSH